MYLALEGIDTCGKSTQLQLLRQALPDAVFTKEPGGSRVGAKLREILLEGEPLDYRTEYLLFLADRARHIEEIVRPNLSRHIVSDRSVISGLAYSHEAIKEDFLLSSTLFAVDGVLPNLAVLLWLDESELTRRLGTKAPDRVEERGIEYLLRVQDSMPKAAEMLGIRCEIMDARESMETIHNNILRFLR